MCYKQEFSVPMTLLKLSSLVERYMDHLYFPMFNLEFIAITKYFYIGQDVLWTMSNT